MTTDLEKSRAMKIKTSLIGAIAENQKKQFSWILKWK
jgi:hypothetical protein